MEYLIPKDPALRWSMLRVPGGRPKDPVPGNRGLLPVPGAREAIYQGLKLLGVAPGDKILAPSYHCSTGIEPIDRLGAEAVFYRQFRDCTPDLEDIRRKIDGKTRGIVIIHYFGFPQPPQAFQELCREHDMFLIEDCAHVLAGRFQGRPVGSHGDVSVFSWRKFLPVPDGGFLVLNRDIRGRHSIGKRGFFRNVKDLARAFEKLGHDSISPSMKRRYYAMKSRFDRFRDLASGPPPPEPHDSARCAPTADLPMSGISRHILRNVDLAYIAERRKANFRRLLAAAGSIRGLDPLYPVLPDHVCPWMFPALCPSRKDFDWSLRCRGIPAFSWKDWIHDKLPIDSFPESEFLYSHLVFLPVHQDLTGMHLDIMVDAIAAELSRGSDPRSGAQHLKKP